MSFQLDPKLITLIQENLLSIILVVSSSIFGTWMWRFRPRSTSESMTEYVDDVLTTKVEQKSFSFFWGRVFFLKKVRIYEVPLSATVELTIIPPDMVEIPLNKEYFEIKPHKKMRRIYLKNKKYFEDQQVNRVIALIKHPVPTDYRSKVMTEPHDTLIQVENSNLFEIKNYQLSLPKNIKLEQLTDSFEVISLIRIEITTPKLRSVLNETINSIDDKGITPNIIIKSLPPREGTNNGRSFIELN